MKRACLILLTLFILFTLPAAEPVPRYFLILYTLKPGVDLAHLTPEQGQGFAAHAANLKRLQQQGILVTGGRTTNPDHVLAVGIVKAEDEAAAGAVAATDPAVLGGYLAADVQPFALVFSPTAPPCSNAPAAR